MQPVGKIGGNMSLNIKKMNKVGNGRLDQNNEELGVLIFSRMSLISVYNILKNYRNPFINVLKKK